VVDKIFSDICIGFPLNRGKVSGIEILKQRNWEHPINSNELKPKDFYLFPTVEHKLLCQKLEDDERWHYY
jgi:hypothetical protein